GLRPGEADRMRRAMATFKRNGEIHLFRDRFIAGMVANGYSHDFATRCFDQIEGFGTYGFPESHAASFALLVYVSAWIKCFHPDVFACALLNSQPMGFYAPAQIVRDAKEHGVEIRPADVNFSHWDCTLEPLVNDAKNLSPPFRGEGEGPIGKRWGGEGGDATAEELRLASNATPSVVPAKAGTHPSALELVEKWVPAFAGTTELVPGNRRALRLGLRQIKGFAEA